MVNFVFNELPADILLEIFSYLPMRDQRILRLVSLHILSLMDDKFRQECTLKITEENIGAIKDHIGKQSSGTFWFKHLQLDGIKSIQCVQLILEEIGEKVEQLTLKNTAVFDILKGNVQNIKSLKLYCDEDLNHNVRHLNFREFPQLIKLEFINNWCWSDDVTTQLLSRLVNNSKIFLKLRHLKICFTADIERSVIDVLLLHSTTLEYLDIHFPDSDNQSDTLWEVVFSCLVNLRTFIFIGYENWLNMVFTSLPAETPLEHIKLNCCNLDDPLLELITIKWQKSLHSIQLIDCRLITDVGLLPLQKLKNLCLFELSSCEEISSEGISNGLLAKTNSNMKELILSSLPKLNESSLHNIAHGLPNLRVLKLNDLPAAVSKNSLDEIFRHQTGLRILCLDYAEMTDEDLIGIGNNSHSIKRLRGLEELSLLYCSNLSDRSLIDALAFSELRSLDLRGCNQITLQGIENLVHNCTSLETLGIAGILTLQQNVLMVIGKGLKRLHKLLISNCDERTAMVKNTFNVLKHCTLLPLFQNCELEIDN